MIVVCDDGICDVEWCHGGMCNTDTRDVVHYVDKSYIGACLCDGGMFDIVMFAVGAFAIYMFEVGMFEDVFEFDM